MAILNVITQSNTTLSIPKQQSNKTNLFDTNEKSP
uniref:Uncharacterized protein n=1 Tax=viral metagenome TaxID=1070528 RepID=A0A6C0LPD6_9ZZZZ